MPHCHFKSNQHLAAALSGDTDLDLLVARSGGRSAQAVLAAAGFKRFDAGLATGYPAVEDWLGFDDDTGRMIHLHVHYALPVGELHLKSYALPLAGAVLETRVRDAETGVATSEPSHELLLLLRALRAEGARPRPHRRARRARRHFRGGALREYQWLMARAEPAPRARDRRARARRGGGGARGAAARAGAGPRRAAPRCAARCAPRSPRIAPGGARGRRCAASRASSCSA